MRGSFKLLIKHLSTHAQSTHTWNDLCDVFVEKDFADLEWVDE